MKSAILIIYILTLVGCASPGYEHYLNTQASVASSRAQADIARYDALAGIANKGDSAASVAAAMALAMGGNTTQPMIQAPQNELLQWASIIVPAVGQAYAIGKSADVAMNASNNATQTSIATTSSFVNIAGKIQAPIVAAPAAAVIPQANITNTYNMSGTGVLGSGTYQTDQLTTSSSYNPSTITNPVTGTTVGP